MGICGLGYLFRTIRSDKFKPAGKVDVPFLGAIVGELADWALTRRGDNGQDAGLYDLRAVFSFVSQALWEDPEYRKRIVLSLNPRKHFRIEQEDGFKTVLEGKSLLMEGVTIHALEDH